MNNLYSKIIKGLEKVQAPQGNYVPPGDTFSQILDRVVLNQTDKETFRTITFITKKYSRGLDEFRNNNLLIGEQYVCEGDIWFKQFSDGPLKDLINVFRLPTVAYLNFKLLKYELAKEQIWEAFQIDEALENKDFYFLHFHRIQQLQNISRLLFAQNQYTEWMESMLEILMYLTAFKAPESGDKWGKSLVMNCPDNWRFGAIYQVLIETITFNNYIKDEKHASGLTFLNALIFEIPDFEANTSDEKAIKKWLLLHKKEDINENIDGVFKFIEEEDSKFDILKAEALISISKKMNKNDKLNNVQDAVRLFVNNQLNVPPKVLKSFYH